MLSSLIYPPQTLLVSLGVSNPAYNLPRLFPQTLSAAGDHPVSIRELGLAISFQIGEWIVKKFVARPHKPKKTVKEQTAKG
jgi:hypothetical protein